MSLSVVSPLQRGRLECVTHPSGWLVAGRLSELTQDEDYVKDGRETLMMPDVCSECGLTDTGWQFTASSGGFEGLAVCSLRAGFEEWTAARQGGYDERIMTYQRMGLKLLYIKEHDRTRNGHKNFPIHFPSF